MPRLRDFGYDVFLSHNTSDKPQVRRLAERLKKAGLRVWFDEWVIGAGDDIYLAIERGLGAARVQVLCLSPAALGSDWVALERSTVLFRDPTKAGRRFIPLMLADCELPDTLRRYKYVDFREEAEAAFEELLTVCRVATEEAPEALPPKPLRWPTTCSRLRTAFWPAVRVPRRGLSALGIVQSTGSGHARSRRRRDHDTERRTSCPVPRRTPERR